MNAENKSPEPPPNDEQKPFGLALFIGFLPSVLLLGTVALDSNLRSSSSGSEYLLWFICAVSVICCIAAGAMLFSRSTLGAILGGTAFMLLNAFIAFYSGCFASLRS